MSVRPVLVLAVILSAAGLGISPAAAQEFQALGSQQLLERLDAQDQRIRELESRLSTTKKPLRMLPAVMESNDNVLYRLEALESAYSNKSLFDGDGIQHSMYGCVL